MMNTRRSRNNKKSCGKNRGKSSKKLAKYVKGGSDFGPASFKPEFGGAYYSLNDYKNDLFGMTESTTRHGGKKGSTKRKRGKLLRRTINKRDNNKL